FNVTHADIEEASSRDSSLLGPVAETVAVLGAMVIVAYAYVFLVKPGHMASSYLLAFGFVLLRLLPLLNQVYSLQGNILYMGGGIREVERWMKALEHRSRPFGDIELKSVRHAIRFRDVSYTYPNGNLALTDIEFDI